MAVVGGGEPRDGVDHQERGVAGGIDGLAHLADQRCGARRGLVVDDADGLDLVRLVLLEAGLDLVGVDARAPVRSDEFGHEAELQRHVLPQRREVARLVHQDFVAGRQGIHERGFPRAGARGREDHDRALGLEDALDAVEDAAAELLELRPAMIDDGHVHGPKDAIGHGRGAGDLQEMAAGAARLIGHRTGSPCWLADGRYGGTCGLVHSMPRDRGITEGASSESGRPAPLSGPNPGRKRLEPS